MNSISSISKRFIAVLTKAIVLILSTILRLEIDHLTLSCRILTSTQRISLIFLVAALLSDVSTQINVNGCKSWQKCLTISECRKAQKENNLPKEAITDFTSSLLYPCDDAKYLTVCCTIHSPNEPITEDPGYTLTSLDYQESKEEISTASFNYQKSKEEIPIAIPLKENEPLNGAKTLPFDKCGLFSKRSNNENSEQGQFPWLALLGNKDLNTEELQFHCGGTLINNRYILTSAYCLESMITPLQIVRLGEYNKSPTEECSSESNNCRSPVQDFGIEKIIMHELFDRPFFKNDISLIRLNATISEFTANIRPICLPTASAPQESKSYTIAGWGLNKRRNMNESSIPKFGTVTLLSEEECSKHLSIVLKPIANTQLCSGADSNSCYGDLGGPLTEYITKENTERAVQVGIVSYAAHKCNDDFSRELYTNVSSFMDWILMNMND